MSINEKKTEVGIIENPEKPEELANVENPEKDAKPEKPEKDAKPAKNKGYSNKNFSDVARMKTSEEFKVAERRWWVLSSDASVTLHTGVSIEKQKEIHKSAKYHRIILALLCVQYSPEEFDFENWKKSVVGRVEKFAKRMRIDVSVAKKLFAAASAWHKEYASKEFATGLKVMYREDYDKRDAGTHKGKRK